MNRTQTLAVALLVAALPFTSVAFASDRDEDDDHERHERHHERYDDHGYRGHHSRHQYRRHQRPRFYCAHHHQYHDHAHDHDEGHGRYNRWEDRGNRIVLPFPPLPPFPVIIFKHHDRH